MISLGGGLPSSEYFPFEHLDVKVPAVGKFTEAETKVSGEIMRIAKHDMKEGKSAWDLSVALNYGQSTGSAQLLRWVTEHTEVRRSRTVFGRWARHQAARFSAARIDLGPSEIDLKRSIVKEDAASDHGHVVTLIHYSIANVSQIVHNPPYRDWACSLSVGSTSSLDMVYRMFLERGDCVISEEYTFATAVESSHPLGCKFVGVRMDGEGMIPEALDEMLLNWNVAARGARKPFLIYTVPSGQNPTGSTQGTARRQEIYKVAQKHDLVIVEDEPYYFLQMGPYVSGNETAPLPKSHEEFIKSLVPSLLSMDVDGRVVRLDSFSKVLSPASRCGWIVASQQVCERFQRHGECSVQCPSGFTQIILHRLLDEHWGHGGYLDWLVSIRVAYTARRNSMLKSCDAHLPKEVASWTPPTAGMFHWISLDLSKHPGGKDAQTVEDEVFNAAIALGVLVTPGSYFLAEHGHVLEKVFFRVTFAAAEVRSGNFCHGVVCPLLTRCSRPRIWTKLFVVSV